MTTPAASRLLGPLFSTDRMREIFSDGARLQGMLDFEAALARAEAAAGVIPGAAAAPIAGSCQAGYFDAEALGREAALAGNVAIPVVRALTALVARADPAAARHVHFGATSQDAQDTGLVLQLRRALDVFEDGLAELSTGLARLAERHRGTLLAGRTWLQHAQPITFGLKAAGWLSAVERHRERLREARARALVVQLGGAVGTLDVLGPRALDVAARVAESLGLGVPDVPWHAHRDRLAEVATMLGLAVGTLGKIATDVALLMQTEVGEAAEPEEPGRGGSSAMPQKRNPVAAAVVRAAALRVPALVSTMLAAMVQEHERGLGGWHAEWETLPEIALLAAGALEQVTRVVRGLEVDAARMRRNLEATEGGIQAAAVAGALAGRLGR
ncbi:MAG TPA: 3-carboxy-cis,cis-muconate cycloisomerase, partial [Anaeromyxobacter sp.]